MGGWVTNGIEVRKCVACGWRPKGIGKVMVLEKQEGSWQMRGVHSSVERQAHQEQGHILQRQSGLEGHHSEFLAEMEVKSGNRVQLYRLGSAQGASSWQNPIILEVGDLDLHRFMTRRTSS